MRTGRAGGALKVLDEAVARLEMNPAETANLAAALLNRSVVHLNAADVRRARPDLVWCQQVAAADGYHRVTAKTLHNLGFCDLLAGDIPAALQLFDAAADGYRLNAPGFLPVLAMDKARALLAVGLPSDAASELDEAMASFRRQRLDHDLAEAELARAEAALAAGELASARRWAQGAERRFRRHGNEACACLAELTRLRARSVSPGRRAPITAEALRLAERLRDCGLVHDADLAELLAARALLAAGRAGRGQAADRARIPPRADGAAGRQPAAAAGSGRTGGARRSARGGIGRAPGGPGHGAGAARPAGQRRPADRDRRLGHGSGRGRPAAGAGTRIRAAGLRLAGTVPGAGVPGQARASARRPAGRRRPGRATPAQPADPAGRAERRPRPAPDKQAGRAAARDQGARLEGQRPGRGQRPSRGQPRRGQCGAGGERADPGGHRGPARRDGRGGRPARIGAPRAARRLRSGRRGDPAVDRRPRHAGRASAALPARGGDQGVGRAPGANADGRDHRAAAALAWR